MMNEAGMEAGPGAGDAFVAEFSIINE